MRYGNKVSPALVAAFFSLSLHAQTGRYILNGSATQNSCNCYTLTQPVNAQNGSVWNANKINLNNSFDYIFNVFLGCKDADGADGIVFILQPISTSIGTVGEGMGFEGIVPSIGISLDTWRNLNRNDPDYDHISIQVNGIVTHSSTDPGPPVQASATSANIEDCQWHTFRITWNPATQLLSTYFDNQFREEAHVDLIGTIFNNDPMVFWGFSAATGAANNLQQFCTALNPDFNASMAGNTSCIGNAITFTNLSQSFAPISGFFWDFGDGTTSIVANPPMHVYPAPGSYEVKFAITGLDGCFSDTLRKTFIIGDYPVANFNIYDTCSDKPPRITEMSQVNFGNITEWQWILDGNPVSTSRYPSLTGLSPGTHDLQLIVKSDHGCSSTLVSRQFILKPVPLIEANFSNGCQNVPVSFNGRQIDNASTITQWKWEFGDGQTSILQNTSHGYLVAGNYNVQLTALANNGCTSGIVTIPLSITEVIANAGRDTMIIQNEPFQLSGSGGVIYNWSPPTGLNNPGIANPVATLQNSITYTLTVTTADGCTDDDQIYINVFKGSSIYVPSGFTPNNDGLNDLLKPSYNGIKTLDYFKIYNRWGELVYSTKNMTDGWDAMVKGINQPTAVYVWILRATDYVGKVYQLKGTSTIIR